MIHPQITFVFLTYNEEKNLPAGLDSIPADLGTVLIVDSFSTDRTLEIAGNRGIPVIQHTFGNYAIQRNWAQEQVSTEWIFPIDADERLTPELVQWIRTDFPKLAADYHGFFFSRRTLFMDRWIRHGGHYPNFHLRLFRRDSVKCEEKAYDQHFTDRVGGAYLTIRNADLINIVSESLFQFTQQHNRWSDLEAGEIVNPGKEVNDGVKPALFGSPVERRRWLKTRIFMKNPLFIRPFLYFIYRYFFRLGILDGIPGLIFHFLQGFWFRFLVDAKVWERNLQNGKNG